MSATIRFEGYWTPAVRIHHSGYDAGVARTIHLDRDSRSREIYVEWRPVRRGNVRLLQDAPDAPLLDGWSIEAEQRGFCVLCNGKLESNSRRHRVMVRDVGEPWAVVYHRKQVIQAYPGGREFVEHHVLQQPGPQIRWYGPAGLGRAWLLEPGTFVETAIQIDGDLDKYEEEVILPGWRATRLDMEVDEENSTSKPFQMKEWRVFGIPIWCDILIRMGSTILVKTSDLQGICKEDEVASLSPGWWKVEAK